MSEPGNQLFAQRNPWIVCNFVLCALRYALSMDCRVKYGPVVCTAQSVDCPTYTYKKNCEIIFVILGWEILLSFKCFYGKSVHIVLWFIELISGTFFTSIHSCGNNKSWHLLEIPCYICITNYLLTYISLLLSINFLGSFFCTISFHTLISSVSMDSSGSFHLHSIGCSYRYVHVTK